MHRMLLRQTVPAALPSRASSRRMRRLIVMATMGLSVLAVSCKKAGQEGPRPAVAGSIEAQDELRGLEEQWELRSHIARKELRPDLQRFIEEYQADPSVARARVMLAQIALYDRRYDAAEEIVQPLIDGFPGVARDEAVVILAAIDNRRGDHQKALARLAPLEGKLLTRESRDQYSRERTSAAMAERRWRLTVAAMTAWLVESGADSAHVKEWISSAIVNVPSRALARLLADWPAESRDPREARARDWIHRLVIEHLAQEALRAQDAQLATDLLEHSPPWLRAGESGDKLAVLATLAQKEAQIVGRAVGVVLGGESVREQRRSVRVALGLMRGLRGDEGKAVKFLAAENRGSLSAALGTLSSLGASVLVAGVDAAGAQEAISFAETRKVPVVVMNEPLQTSGLDYGFVFGVGYDAEREAAERVFAVTRWISVGTKAVPCSGPVSRPSTVSFPLFQWRDDGTEGILILGDEDCARRLTSEIAGIGWSPLVVWGLEAAHSLTTPTENTAALRAGSFPRPQRTPSTDRMSEIEKAMTEGGSPAEILPRDWYFTLGLDVAGLARAALSKLPENAVTDQTEVRRRHQLARDALLKARVELVSTSARGFSPNHRVERELFAEAVADRKADENAR